MPAHRGALESAFRLAHKLAGCGHRENLQARLRACHGLGTCASVTLTHVANDIGLSRERVRQIDNLAIERLAEMDSARAALVAALGVIQDAGPGWRDATRAARRVLGDDIYLPSLLRLADAFGYKVPPVGLARVMEAHGISKDLLACALERAAGFEAPAGLIAKWLKEPIDASDEPAPLWVIELAQHAHDWQHRLVGFPEGYENLSQPELIREVMRRTGKTRAEMMDALQVRRATFDRWLWPANQPAPISDAKLTLLALLAHSAPKVPPPRRRQLGSSEKQYALNGVPGCARSAVARSTRARISLHKLCQSACFQPPSFPAEGWLLVCETHSEHHRVPSFSKGARLATTPEQWCTTCANMVGATKNRPGANQVGVNEVTSAASPSP